MRVLPTGVATGTRLKALRWRFAVLRGGLLNTGLIIPGRGVERHVESVPTIDRDNRQGKLGEFSLAELLTSRVIHGVRNGLASGRIIDVPTTRFRCHDP